MEFKLFNKRFITKNIRLTAYVDGVDRVDRHQLHITIIKIS